MSCEHTCQINNIVNTRQAEHFNLQGSSRSSLHAQRGGGERLRSRACRVAYRCSLWHPPIMIPPPNRRILLVVNIRKRRLHRQSVIRGPLRETRVVQGKSGCVLFKESNESKEEGRRGDATPSVGKHRSAASRIGGAPPHRFKRFADLLTAIEAATRAVDDSRVWQVDRDGDMPTSAVA